METTLHTDLTTMNERLDNGVQISVSMNRGRVSQSCLNFIASGETGVVLSSGVSTQQQQQQPQLAPTKTLSQDQIQVDQLPCSVLHQRPPSSSHKKLRIDMFVNQNSILWNRIEGYERTCNELNQKKNDLQERNCINGKEIDDYQASNYVLEQEYNTLAKDSQNKSVQSKSLSQQFLSLQDLNTKLKETSSQAQMFIRSITLKKQDQQFELINNSSVIQNESLPNSKLQEEYQQQMSLEQLQKQQGTMTNDYQKWVKKVTSQKKQNMKKVNDKRNNHTSISSPMLAPDPASTTQYARTVSQQQQQQQQQLHAYQSINHKK